jgi:pilus assembly protein Flp/PilA
MIFLGKEVIAMLCSIHTHGQGLVEYALLILLIAIIAIVTFLVIGPAVGNALSKINSQLATY